MSLTLILVAMTCIISYQAMENNVMRNKLLMRPASVKEFGEFYRLLTSGFVHGSWPHLMINMYVLYVFGEQIEGVFNSVFGSIMGKALFLGLYLGAVIFSSIPSYLKHQNNPYYAALGASGGTSAIIFAYIFFAPWAWFIFPPLPAILMGIGYLWYSSYMSKNGNDNIGHDAHFWGSVFGIVFMVGISLSFAPKLLDVFLAQLMAGPTPPPFFN